MVWYGTRGERSATRGSLTVGGEIIRKISRVSVCSLDLECVLLRWDEMGWEEGWIEGFILLSGHYGSIKNFYIEGMYNCVSCSD